MIPRYIIYGVILFCNFRDNVFLYFRSEVDEIIWESQ